MEDERMEELDCIAAIFPEILVDPDNQFCVSMTIPVHPTAPVKVLFPASSDGLLPTPPLSIMSGQENGLEERLVNDVESQNLSYLPSLQLRITLPGGYPEHEAPNFELSTDPAWLSRPQLDELQQKGDKLWEDAGRSSVIYGYIDFLQQEAENAFGFAKEGRNLEVPQDFKISLLDYDIKATQAAFEKETFDCGVCLDPKKGTACHRMIDCGHVFCVECLQDFYNNAITEGNLAAVQCLTPGCAKKRGAAQATNGRRKPKTQLSPSELIQIPLEQEVVTRYVKLKHKAELESDKNTVYCPRKWCQGAARSKKHRKPVGFEEADSDGESDDEDEKLFVAGKDRLCICEDCSFAFCSRCFQGWHGELTICTPRKDTGELTEEDKASLEYLKLHSTPCPTCASPAQKTHGCNHMICFKCHSHFCYLCSAWLPPANPYNHYNNTSSSCYYRLWELEEGDGDDVGQGYGGGVRPVELHQEGEEEAELPLPMVEEPPPIPEILEPAEMLAPLQREGPLVLRINHVPAPPQAPEVPPPVENRRGPQRQAQRAPLNPNQRRVVRPRGAQAAGRRGNEVAEQAEAAQQAAQQAWVQMFVQMALNDEEDQLESDDEDQAAWEIPNSKTSVDYAPHPTTSIAVSEERSEIVARICALNSCTACETGMSAEKAIYDGPWSYCDAIAGQWYGIPKIMSSSRTLAAEIVSSTPKALVFKLPQEYKPVLAPAAKTVNSLVSLSLETCEYGGEKEVYHKDVWNEKDYSHEGLGQVFKTLIGNQLTKIARPAQTL